MIAVIEPGRLSGSVRVPASKSAAHRLLICAALADAPTRVEISALNRDIETTMACLRALGAVIEPGDGAWRVTPIGAIPRTAGLDCGESGSTLRFLLPVAAALGTSALLTGGGRLPERPMAALTEALREHGAQIDSDRLPMRLSGSLRGGAWTLPGDISSQYVTALLFALPLLAHDSELRLTTPLESAPYVEMTLKVLRAFGIRVAPLPGGWRVPGGQRYRSPGAIAAEGDWAAAALWMAANRLGCDIRIEGLPDDTVLMDRRMPALMGQPEIDARNVPDLVPALAAVAAALPQRTVFTGAARLRLKESDRLASIAAMLKALGGRAEVTGDGLIIDGGQPLRGGTVDGANDHRIVMAAAVLAVCCESPVRIIGAQAVQKSYPEFFNDYVKLGGRVHVEPTGQ